MKFRSLRTALRLNRPPSCGNRRSTFVLYEFCRGRKSSRLRRIEFRAVFGNEFTRARAPYGMEQENFCRAYLVFGPGEVRELMADLMQTTVDHGALAPSQLARGGTGASSSFILQRFAAKNDTFSEFGPTGWGNISMEMMVMSLPPHPRYYAREVFLERWAAHVRGQGDERRSRNFRGVAHRG